MNRLDSVWQDYLNMRVQLVEAAVADGKTDAEIQEVLYGETSKNQADVLINTVRTYVKAPSDLPVLQ
ncbi:hypothetical protein FROZEN_19 [Erwinia phage vB_EamP_Frozen]|uniref:Uncharacterized protein n=2 Tax=Johnsonvirus frozen TaxID=1982578 RepID=A0A191ZD68_9CAUD|nr:hypothetical protein FROZEN_19 [Erwinia phage vB_EamP_Frozen]ANJ65151.1 hypothetical protein FROZEN_19 [Erwinia phage vB_EamP_Frozen]ANJ65335.1 hypothetical protein GUTMEISTER_19 [Erwinia phage vB_EamP_Gutmeister]